MGAGQPAACPAWQRSLGTALTAPRGGQVEYYFSRENLYQDAFLVSKMDAAHFVEVSVIAGFKMVKQLTSDHTLILESVKDSDKVPAAPSAARPPAPPASLRPAREAAACPRPGTGRAPGTPPHARSTAAIVRLRVGSRALPPPPPLVLSGHAASLTPY